MNTNVKSNMEKETSVIESQKLLYDTYKHLTTLSTGAILILAAFLEKFFKTPKWKILIAITFVTFVISTVSSVLAMFGISDEVSGDPLFGERSALIVIAVICETFLLGIICLAVFSIRKFLDVRGLRSRAEILYLCRA